MGETRGARITRWLFTKLGKRDSDSPRGNIHSRKGMTVFNVTAGKNGLLGSGPSLKEDDGVGDADTC